MSDAYRVQARGLTWKNKVFMSHMMSLRILLAVLAVVGAQEYTDRYDNMNVDEVLANRRLLQAYVRCVLDQGRCTAEGRELKSHITEALQNGCDKCTDTQKVSIKKVIGHIMNNENSWWKELVQKYDPQGIYAERYENELKLI